MRYGLLREPVKQALKAALEAPERGVRDAARKALVEFEVREKADKVQGATPAK